MLGGMGDLFQDQFPEKRKQKFNVIDSSLEQGYAAGRTGYMLSAERQISRLRTELSELKHRISVQTVPLDTLHNIRWELKKVLFITIEHRDTDSFVAASYDADCYGYGTDIPEAIDDFRGVIVDQYEFLLWESKRVTLSKHLQMQLDYLKSIIREKNA